MRRGMRGLALQVQEGLGRDPFAGDIYIFRGRSGSLIKALWHDGLGLSLYANVWIEVGLSGRKPWTVRYL
jgi:transposase